MNTEFTYKNHKVEIKIAPAYIPQQPTMWEAWIDGEYADRTRSQAHDAIKAAMDIIDEYGDAWRDCIM